MDLFSLNELGEFSARTPDGSSALTDQLTPIGGRTNGVDFCKLIKSARWSRATSADLSEQIQSIGSPKMAPNVKNYIR